MADITIKEVEDYFNKVGYTDDIIELDSCTTILNMELFVKSHIQALRSNSGHKLFLPYYERLISFYKIHKGI